MCVAVDGVDICVCLQVFDEMSRTFETDASRSHMVKEGYTAEIVDCGEAVGYVPPPLPEPLERCVCWCLGDVCVIVSGR